MRHLTSLQITCSLPNTVSLRDEHCQSQVDNSMCCALMDCILEWLSSEEDTRTTKLALQVKCLMQNVILQQTLFGWANAHWFAQLSGFFH